MFRLALCLGKTVGELERTMSAVELREWMLFNRIEPLPDPHGDAALISAIVVRSQGGKADIEDFMPWVEKAKPEAMSARDSFRALKAALGSQFVVVDSRKE